MFCVFLSSHEPEKRRIRKSHLQFNSVLKLVVSTIATLLLRTIEMCFHLQWKKSAEKVLLLNY